MDKIVLKIAGIIAFIVGILYCVTIVGAIFGIPLIIGGLKFKELSDLPDEEVRNQKDTLLIWTIVMFFLCLISGVLGLIYYLNMENPNMFKSNNTSSKYNDLEQINKLYKDKVITKEEFEKEKERILNK